ncbi:hypothetical protein [Streptomyces sp. NBC_00343]|uniref:hypothetical protein n=1 Tax=Streptomyces sp. NBC_00343 TaxID=2975719 RepID=UPI002E2B05A4|nr:hypothetical protein [Streptomyces sp. NBC_00343]
MDDSLSFESFLEGAKKAAHRAVDDHGRGEYDEFALHGGVAVERLAKAVLVSKNPVYLLEMRNGNPDMLLYLGGHLEMSADKVRTVGAKDTIKRLRTLGLLPSDSQLDLLIELRNGTAHTTVGDQAKVLLPTLAENIAALLSDIDLPEEAFWGRWTSAMNMAVNKQRSAIERDVGIRIRQARHAFDDRFEGLPTGAKERALTEPSPERYPFDVSLFRAPAEDHHYFILATTECPACSGTAALKLQPTMKAEIKLGRQMVLEELHCPLCHLSLHTSAEVHASGAQNPLASGRPTHTVTVTGFRLPEPYRGATDAQAG